MRYSYRRQHKNFFVMIFAQSKCVNLEKVKFFCSKKTSENKDLNQRFHKVFNQKETKSLFYAK